MADKEPEGIKELKEQVVAAAAEAIVASMTPAMMRKAAEGIIEQVLSNLSSSPYNTLGRMVDQVAEKTMKEYIHKENWLTLL
jgi:hypothetical protein